MAGDQDDDVVASFTLEGGDVIEFMTYMKNTKSLSETGICTLYCNCKQGAARNCYRNHGSACPETVAEFQSSDSENSIYSLYSVSCQPKGRAHSQICNYIDNNCTTLPPQILDNKSDKTASSSRHVYFPYYLHSIYSACAKGFERFKFKGKKKHDLPHPSCSSLILTFYQLKSSPAGTLPYPEYSWFVELATGGLINLSDTQQQLTRIARPRIEYSKYFPWRSINSLQALPVQNSARARARQQTTKTKKNLKNVLLKCSDMLESSLPLCVIGDWINITFTQRFSCLSLETVQENSSMKVQLPLQGSKSVCDDFDYGTLTKVWRFVACCALFWKFCKISNIIISNSEYIKYGFSLFQRQQLAQSDLKHLADSRIFDFVNRDNSKILFIGLTIRNSASA